MAIDKIEKNTKTEWTKHSRAHYGIAAGIFALSAIFLYMAFSKYMLKSSYAEALRNYDGGKKASVKDSATSAVGWGSSHYEARELLATWYVEKGFFPQAEEAYAELVKRGHNKAAVAAGRGVIALRQADGEKDAKKLEGLLKTAKDRFNEAKGLDENCMEAHIGLLTADLLAALKPQVDKVKLGKVRDEFTKLLKKIAGSEELGRATTRGGLLDLYSGVARSSFSPEKFSKEAAAANDACVRYHPTSLPLQVNQLYFEAQGVAEGSFTAEDFKKGALLTRVNDLRNKFSSGTSFDALVEPWLQLTIATIGVYGRAADGASFEKMVQYLDNPKVKNLHAARFAECMTKLDRANVAGLAINERRSLMSNAYSAHARYAKDIPSDDAASAAMKAILLNNTGFLEEDQGASGGGNSLFEKAVNTFKSALEAEAKSGSPDGTYETLRNIAVLQKRMAKPDADEYYHKALKAGAARPEPRIAADMAQFKEYFAGTLKD